MKIILFVILFALTVQNQYKGYFEVNKWQNVTFNQAFLTSQSQFIATTNSSIFLVDLFKPNETIKTIALVTNSTVQIKGLFGTDSLGYIDNQQVKSISIKGPQSFNLTQSSSNSRIVVVKNKIYYSRYLSNIGVNSYDLVTGIQQSSPQTVSPGQSIYSSIIYNNQTKFIYYGNQYRKMIMIFNENLQYVQVINQTVFDLQISSKGDILAVYQSGMFSVQFYLRNQKNNKYQKIMSFRIHQFNHPFGLIFIETQKILSRIVEYYENYNAFLLYTVDPNSKQMQYLSFPEQDLIDFYVLKDFKTVIGRTNNQSFNQIIQYSIQSQKFINTNNYKLTISYQRQFSQKDSYSEDGTLLFIAQNKSEETVRLWSIKNDSLICQAKRNASIKSTSQVKFEYDNSRFFVLTDQTLYVFNSSNCEQIKTLSDINITNFWLVKDKSKIVATGMKINNKTLFQLHPLSFAIRKQVKIFSQKQIMLTSQKICGYLSQSKQFTVTQPQFLVIYDQNFQIKIKKPYNCRKNRLDEIYLSFGMNHITLFCPIDNTFITYDSQSLQLISISFSVRSSRNIIFQTFKSDLRIWGFGTVGNIQNIGLYQQYNNMINKDYFVYNNSRRICGDYIALRDQNTFITLEYQIPNDKVKYLTVHGIVGGQLKILRQAPITILVTDYNELKLSSDMRYILVTDTSATGTRCYDYQILKLVFPIPGSEQSQFDLQQKTTKIKNIQNIQAHNYISGSYLGTDGVLYMMSEKDKNIISRYDLKQPSSFKPQNMSVLTGPLSFSSDEQFLLFAGKGNNEKYIIDKWKRFPHQFDSSYQTLSFSQIQQLQFLPNSQNYLIVQGQVLYLNEEGIFRKIASQVNKFQLINSNTLICHYTNKTFTYIKLSDSFEKFKKTMILNAVISGDLLSISPNKNMIAVLNGQNIQILNLINNTQFSSKGTLPQNQSNGKNMLINSKGTIFVLYESSVKLFQFLQCSYDKQYSAGACVCPKYSTLQQSTCKCDFNRSMDENHSCQCYKNWLEIDSICCPKYSISVVNDKCVCEDNRYLSDSVCSCMTDLIEIDSTCCPKHTKSVVNGICVCQEKRQLNGSSCQCIAQFAQVQGVCCPNYLQSLVNGDCICKQGKYFVSDKPACQVCSFLCSSCQNGGLFEFKSYSKWFFGICLALIVIVAGTIIFILIKIKKIKQAQNDQKQQDDSKYENILSQQQSIEAEKE